MTEILAFLLFVLFILVGIYNYSTDKQIEILNERITRMERKTIWKA